MQDNISLMSIGFLLGGPDEAVIWRGPKKNGMYAISYLLHFATSARIGYSLYFIPYNVFEFNDSWSSNNRGNFPLICFLAFAYLWL